MARYPRECVVRATNFNLHKDTHVTLFFREGRITLMPRRFGRTFQHYNAHLLTIILPTDIFADLRSAIRGARQSSLGHHYITAERAGILRIACEYGRKYRYVQSNVRSVASVRACAPSRASGRVRARYARTVPRNRVRAI